uniref:Uncharacterized protein n=1 Tax=viral metagenome TaxID=1070528 RepID=A0A6C0JVC2_9ZZZZ
MSTEFAFHIESKEIYWGQFDTILEGVGYSTKCDNDVMKAPKSIGSTHYQVVHQYKCRAKNGKWIKQVINFNDDSLGISDVDFVVVCHETVNPLEIIKESLETTFSDEPDYTKDCRYINRYDWGYITRTHFDRYKMFATSFMMVDKIWADYVYKFLTDPLFEVSESFNVNPEGILKIRAKLEGGSPSFNEKLNKCLAKLKTKKKVDDDELEKIFDNGKVLEDSLKTYGIFDHTFKEYDWIYGKMLFEKETKDLKAFVITNEGDT